MQGECGHEVDAEGGLQIRVINNNKMHSDDDESIRPSNYYDSDDADTETQTDFRVSIEPYHEAAH